jgi:DUF1680 family protein
MPVIVNGHDAGVGTPGNYLPLERIWQEGDLVQFSLPAETTIVRYRGADYTEWHFVMVCCMAPFC